MDGHMDFVTASPSHSFPTPFPSPPTPVILWLMLTGNWVQRSGSSLFYAPRQDGLEVWH
jgi:hypothetical protein